MEAEPVHRFSRDWWQWRPPSRFQRRPVNQPKPFRAQPQPKVVRLHQQRICQVSRETSFLLQGLLINSPLITSQLNRIESRHKSRGRLSGSHPPTSRWAWRAQRPRKCQADLNCPSRHPPLPLVPTPIQQPPDPVSTFSVAQGAGQVITGTSPSF